ncbi:unnamed protein product [Diamesa tonsa]
MRFGNWAKIGLGWSLFVVLGVGGFVVSKNSVDKKRYESMKVRERMRKSNDGDYEDFQDTKRFDI